MLTLFLVALIVCLILATTELVVTWLLLAMFAIVLILGFTYLARKQRRQWEVEAGLHDD